jgi:dienelactone hydrolase
MNRKKPLKALLAMALLTDVAALADRARAQDLATTELRLPTHGSGKKGLEAVMIRPNDAAPHPLALLTHGTPRDPTERADMTPLRFIPQAREFARRGWTAVVVMRRGYGDSGGSYEENAHACGRNADYTDATKQSVKDLREAAEYLATRPEVDPSRMIGVGVSTGGLAMVGLAADPPPGLVAAISFAGGRGSNAPDTVCNPEQLAETFGYFGKRAKVPMLWVYATNDHFFGPQLAQSFYSAYQQNGGRATFIAATSFGEDGHGLFSQRGIPIWTPMVDEFLKNEKLILRDSPLEVSVPVVEPPSTLDVSRRDAFPFYLVAAPHKAFAVSQGGHYGNSFGRRSVDEAKKLAMENCVKAAPKNDPCTIVMVDDVKAQN